MFRGLVGAPAQFNTVLFGGLLGSLFSFLQFIASPIIGGLSDRFGRKPLMIGTCVGKVLYGLIGPFPSPDMFSQVFPSPTCCGSSPVTLLSLFSPESSEEYLKVIIVTNSLRLILIIFLRKRESLHSNCNRCLHSE